MLVKLFYTNVHGLVVKNVRGMTITRNDANIQLAPSSLRFADIVAFAVVPTARLIIVGKKIMDIINVQSVKIGFIHVFYRKRDAMT